ncbi:unnamed protein product, partial [Trichogramma brassicae]
MLRRSRLLMTPMPSLHLRSNSDPISSGPSWSSCIRSFIGERTNRVATEPFFSATITSGLYIR